MIHIETQYLGFTRILLLAIGIWPYQQSRLTRFQFIFFFAILLASIIFQLTRFVTTKYTSDLAAVLSSTSFFIILMIKYYTFRINIGTMKKLFIQLQHICNELKDKNEIAIIKKYGYIGKRYTVILTVIGTCGVFCIISVQFWTSETDVLSRNITRSHDTHFVTEYFVDQKKYYSLIQLHMNIAICIGITAMIATGSIFIAYFKFICGIFQISSLPNHFLSKFGTMYFILAQAFVISLCFNFVRIFQVVLSKQTIREAYLPAIMAFTNILYLFISNSLGQNMTDYNNYVFDTVYKVKWYVTPLHIQKIILFLLLKGTKNFTLSVGLFVPSFECFAMLVKASVSYFTVVLSTQ